MLQLRLGFAVVVVVVVKLKLESLVTSNRYRVRKYDLSDSTQEL